MLTTRKIGEVYYVRGTVRVGKQTIKVPERTTGFRKASDAKEYVSCLEKEIIDSVLHPKQDRTNKTLFDDCFKIYMSKKRPSIKEFSKLKVLIQYFEGCKVSDILSKWNVFCELKKDRSIGTLNRYANSLNSILQCGKEELNIEPPKIKRERDTKTVVFLLPDGVKEKLLECYSPYVKPVFITLAYQGFREQECLQLLWEDINLKEKLIVIRTSKNGETRTTPMHRKVWWAIARQWIKQGKPITGHVWLNRDGKPYKDNRKEEIGSPIYKAHIWALERLKRKYGITIKMRVHDWRHDWAGRMVMAGNDLLTVQKLGGWKCMSMVARYATFSAKHEQDSINKI